MTKDKKQTEDKMKQTKVKSKDSTSKLEQQVSELTKDLQRTRADFENYRKRVDEEKVRTRELGAEQVVVKLLPIFDTIDKAVAHFPDDLKGNAWAEGVASISKNLAKLIDDLKLEKIEADAGKTKFDPELHHAISVDETDGETEIVAEELQSGYKLKGNVVRESLVRVTRK